MAELEKSKNHKQQDLELWHYNSSTPGDAIDDKRYGVISGVYKYQVCTGASATKGSGTWVDIIIEAYITDLTAIGLLEDTGNWDINGNYTGVAIALTYQGQKHYDSDYMFEAVGDNNWIRIARV